MKGGKTMRKMQKSGDEARGRERLLTVPFVMLTVLSCMVTVCLQMTVTAVPLMTVSWGYDPSVAGISTTACTLAALLFRPASARLAIRLGEKKCALYGAGIYIIVFVLCLKNRDLWGLLILRTLQGVGMSLLTTSVGAMLTARLPKCRIAEGMGYFGLGNAVALSLGPSIGLVLSRHGGFSCVFLFGIFLSVFIAVSLLFFHGNNGGGQARPTEGKVGKKKGFWKLAAGSGALLPSFFSISLIFCQMSLSTYLSFWGAENAIVDVSIFFTTNLFGMIVSRLCLGKLCRWFGEPFVCMASVILLAVSYLLIALYIDVPVLWIAGTAYGLGYGILYSFMNAAAVEQSNGENRSAANAVFFGAKDLGSAAGAVLWGGILAVMDYGMLYLLSAGLTFVGGMGFFCWKRQR